MVMSIEKQTKAVDMLDVLGVRVDHADSRRVHMSYDFGQDQVEMSLPYSSFESMEMLFEGIYFELKRELLEKGRKEMQNDLKRLLNIKDHDEVDRYD
jgi:hypothetical protein